jgi:PD-(D/E)XK endonuclease
MHHPKIVGDRCMLAVMLALHDAGFHVSVPFGENTRYDLLIDDGSTLGRVQCKNGRLRSGAIRFATCSSYGHHRDPLTARRDYHGQVDYFAIFCPETRGVYLVPIEDLPVKVSAALRVDETRNGQKRGIRRADRYHVGNVASETGTRNAIPRPAFNRV